MWRELKRLGGFYVQQAVCVLPDREDLHNHVGGPHAGALFALGETASGAVVLGAFADQLGRATPLAVRADIAYQKLARGDVTATARLGADRTAQRMGARTVHYVPHKPDDAAEQIALIDEALAARPAACALVPAHPTAVNLAIRKIHAAGVPGTVAGDYSDDA